MNLTEQLIASAERWPDKAAFVSDTGTVTYAQLRATVEVLAEKLRGLKLAAGSRVGLCFPNSVDYVALTYALWQVNATVVPVPTECPPEELSEIADTMHLSVVLSERALSIGQSEPLAEGIFATHTGERTESIVPLSNVAFIRFTSGTTNARKGVVLCHETIAARVVAANRALDIAERDTVVWCLPMAHHFLVTIVLYLRAGATVVLARHVTARPFLEAVNRWHGTVLYAAPFHYSLLARDASGLQMSSVRLAVSTTCALPQDVAEAFFARFGRPLVPALGIIELGLVAMNTEDPRGRWNSVGKPLPDFRVKIVAPDAEGCGELAVAGPGMCDAYAAPWQSRAELLRDGWFVTGDIARLDAEGFLYLLSRKTAVINLAGRKVFPEEIETVLDRHPGIRESRVFGRAHPHLGEVVEAEIVLREGEAAIANLPHYCREHLASYKIPTRFHIVPSVPRTAVTGKIRRTVAG